MNKQKKLYLGNLDAKRDWGHARDYVKCMWLILQQKEPDDYIIATGKMHTVREFCELAFKEIGIDIIWKGKGINEKGINSKNNQIIIEVDPIYFRPTEVNELCGDPSKAIQKLNWNPFNTSFEDLVHEMVVEDIKFVKNEK